MPYGIVMKAFISNGYFPRTLAIASRKALRPKSLHFINAHYKSWSAIMLDKTAIEGNSQS
ncbi:MAG: hypothetical protein IM586_17445 [Pseudanabaena sp. M172S2SP2A07QC]|nr:hypothetical protein [Pseudanabaena sp. M172S2SP2A07QC]MCA6527682.1 hypothetical protein [Pseudanabaena sp. M179S2SP2A07QC]MCA6624726.1 hypothetical protein [Pseudanabaena sp. M165S2SP1A06QC]